MGGTRIIWCGSFLFIEGILSFDEKIFLEFFTKKSGK